MRSFNLSTRSVYVFIYTAVCASCLVTTALQIRIPEMIMPAIGYQLVLLLATAVGLLPEGKGTSGFLTRMDLILCAVLSVAINIGCYAIIHRTVGIHDSTDFGGPISLIDASYFSIVTFTTLGFGDLQPTPDGRIYAAIQALSGYVYLGIVIGLAVNGFNPLSRKDGGQETSE